MTSRVKSKFEFRLRTIKYVVLLIWFGLAVRLFWLQVVNYPKFARAAEAQHNVWIEIQPRRGTIYDCRGKVLAQDIDSYSYYIVPEKIEDKVQVARKLESLTGSSDWRKKMDVHPRFLWVARKTTPEQQLVFNKSGIPTLDSIIEPKRTYPNGDVGLAVLGRVDIDNHGISGIELQYDSLLSGKPGKALLKRYGIKRTFLLNDESYQQPENGRDLVLTLDFDLQQIIEQELEAGLAQFGGKAATAIFLRCGSGEIVASASTDSGGFPAKRNRAITDMYEPGSTFKVLTISRGLESGRFTPETIIDVENGKYRVDGHIINDDHPYDKLSVKDIVVHSSNIGAAKIGRSLGDYAMYKAITDAGFARRLGVDFPGEATGKLLRPSWAQHYLANVSFGHGISATPLQMAVLYDAVASNGKLSFPHLGKEVILQDGNRQELNSQRPAKEIMRFETAATLRIFLREVVTKGTAKRADSAIVDICGKTGTALKIRQDGKGYDKSRSMASFVGFFPADLPAYVGIVVFDEPKKSRYGGEVAVPVFRKIAERFSVLPGKIDGRTVGKDNGRMQETARSKFSKTDSIRAMLASMQIESDSTGNFVTPDFRGMTIRQALLYAKRLGISCDFDGSGIVIEQIPAAGKACQNGTIIKLRCRSE